MNNMTNVSFSFVNREANTWAHILARGSIRDNGVGEWVDHPPDCIMDSIHN